MLGTDRQIDRDKEREGGRERGYRQGQRYRKERIDNTNTNVVNTPPKKKDKGVMWDRLKCYQFKFKWQN